MRRAAAAVFAVAILATVRAEQELPLEVVLARAADYVADYSKRLAAIVAEEDYRQQVISSSRPGRISGRQHHLLRSDVLLVKPGEGEWWLQFRDVFEVDRKPVRDRDERLYTLFVEAKADRDHQAQIIQHESARYNIGPLLRETYVVIQQNVVINGHATYSRFRQFTVTTTEKPKQQ